MNEEQRNLLKDILLNNKEDNTIEYFLDNLKKAMENELLKTKFKESMAIQNEEGMDNFMYLCKRNSIKFASALLDYDCVKLTNQDNEGLTCLTWAIFSKSENLIYKIIDKEPSLLEVCCKQNISPITYAIRQKLFNIVLYMLQKNNNLFNCIDNTNTTPFVYLIDKIHSMSDDIVDQISVFLKENSLKKICLSDKPDNIIKTLKCEICLNQNHSELFNIVNYIFDNNIEIKIGQVNTNGDNAMIFSSFVMNEELAIKLFVQYGEKCNFSNKNNAGETSFSFAVKYKLLNYVTILIESDIEDIGHDVCINNCKSPLFDLIEYGEEDLILKLLNRRHTNLEICNDKGDTILTLAIKKNMINLVNKLIDIDVDIDYSIDSNESPLMLAAKNNMEDIILKMFSVKPDLYVIENEDFENSAVYWICINNLTNVGKIIFEKIDKILYFKYESNWNKLLNLLKNDKNIINNEKNNYFIHHIFKELIYVKQIKKIEEEEEKQRCLLRQQELIKELEEEDKKLKEQKQKKLAKKKALKEKEKAKKIERQKRFEENNSKKIILKPSSISNLVISDSNNFEDNIQIVNDSSSINIDIVQSNNTIEVKSPRENNTNLAIDNNDEISNILNKKYQLENWYFELEKIKF
jgi:hypothetical protein